jgi:hypothetical protein
VGPAAAAWVAGCEPSWPRIDSLSQKAQTDRNETRPPQHAFNGRRGVFRAFYLISVRSLNIGRYIAITMTPTIMPTPIIMIGSMIDVSDWIAASTSSS